MVLAFWVVTILIGISLIVVLAELKKNFDFSLFIGWVLMCFIFAVFFFILKDGQFILK